MLSSNMNSASYSNMKSDLYRVISDALKGHEKGHERHLENIATHLSAIHDLLKELVDGRSSDSSV